MFLIVVLWKTQNCPSNWPFKNLPTTKAKSKAVIPNYIKPLLLWPLLQSSCLETPRDGGAWWAAVHGVAGGRTRLSDFTFTLHFHALEKDMATHSSVLAWRIPGTGEPGGLQSMGSLRVGRDWAASLSLFTCMHWRRTWQPTPVFLPGESQGQGSLVGCRLWGHTESDTTEVT